MMYKTVFKQSISIIIIAAFLFIAVTLTACGEGNQSSIGETVPQIQTSALIESETMPQPDIPAGTDLDGFIINFLVRETGKWAIKDIYAESENGDTINDAVYRRNVATEDKYNFRITQSEANDSGLYQNINKSVMSGDDIYQAVMVNSTNIAKLAIEGSLLDLGEMKYIDLSKPWWDERAVENLSINGHTYYSTGDISTMDNSATYVISFNKSLINEYNLDSPYSLVDSDNWNMESFVRLAKSVSKDLDGNGVIDKEDLFGYMSYGAQGIGFIYAAGGKLADIQPDGTISPDFFNERTVKMIQILTDLSKSDNSFFFTNDDIANDIFVEGRTLFSFRTLINLIYYRDMETDFGILPMPKLDDRQERYHCGVHAYGLSMIGVPVTAADPDSIGVIIEALAAASVDTLTPAYYDITLNGKYFRDEESGRMLDIVFDSRLYDLGYFGDWGGIPARLNTMSANRTDDFASMYASLESKLINDIENTIEMFSKNK